MKTLNIDFLIENSVDALISDLDNIWTELIQEVQLYLGLEVISKKIKWTPAFNSDSESIENIEDFFNIGIEKNQQDGMTLISISSCYIKFLPVILLREAYKCFIPHELQHNEIVNIFINQKVEIDLEKLPAIKEWSSLFRNKMINYDFLAAEFNRLDKFLRRGSSKLFESPFQYFIRFVRQSSQVVGESKKGFYNLFFRDYTFRSSKNLFSKDMVETIRVIIKIFYKIQKYSELLKYQDYFKKFKKEGIIQTTLSERSFVANMRWLKRYSDFSPSYQVNWIALDISIVLMKLTFNPLIKAQAIDTVMNAFPFFIFARRAYIGFGLEIVGYCVLPREYYNDLLEFIKKLEEFGYIIRAKCFLYDSIERNLNLNYFSKTGNKRTLINPYHTDYRKDFLMKFQMEYHPKPSEGNHKTPIISLSILEWLLIDRIRFFSITGFGFERKEVALNTLKSDLVDEILSQRNVITELKAHLRKITRDEEFKKRFLRFLDLNRRKGSFFVRDILKRILLACSLIKDLLHQNHSIRSLNQLQTYLIEKSFHISRTIEDCLLINRSDLKEILFHDLIPLYFHSEVLYTEKVAEFQSYYDILTSCQSLKIFNLEFIKIIVNDPLQVDHIFKEKEQKLKEYYESYKDYKITNTLVEQMLDRFLEIGIIKPIALSTLFFPRFTEYHFIIKSSNNNVERLEILKSLFVSCSHHYAIEIHEKKGYLFVIVETGFLGSKSLAKVVSFIYTIFKNDIIYFTPYLSRQISDIFTRRDFYDLERKNFFYTPDLFAQFLLFTKNILGDSLKPLEELSDNNISTKLEMLWSKEDSLKDLIEFTYSQVSYNSFDIKHLSKLSQFHLGLPHFLLDESKYQKTREEHFFQNYIKSIRFIPAFQSFGLGQYFLYFYPSDINEIDFKLLLSNIFQKVKYDLRIDTSNFFLIKFLSPYGSPGISSYLNWLTKSKRTIREYCLFVVKKVYCIFHFNFNLDANGWDMDPNRFKTHFHNILFNPKYKSRITELKEYNLGESNNSAISNSQEFQILTHIYNWRSLDIKSYLGTKKRATVQYITELLEQQLIFPYLSLKNLELYEKLNIILPNVKKEYNEVLLKIFNFFNYGYIYEMEGEYYIHGFKEEITFENGLMIKLYLPECHLNELVRHFGLLFQYLGIDYHLILPNLTNGNQLLKSIYGDDEFLKTYNPLTNFIWNKTDKIWMNHKLFTEDFEPIYPDLFFGKKRYE